jgi:adenylate cyclase
LTGERVERRLAAILAADVVGYSRLVSADEADALIRLGKLRRDIIETNIASHSGRLFKIMGDGFLAEFASAVQAISCALAIQTETEAAASGFDDAQKIRLGIGIHVGDVLVEGEDLMGDGINIAARLESIAAPGGISISRAVHDQVRDRIKITFDDKGEVALKNIARPVQVFAVAGAKSAVSIKVTPSALALPDKPSIAVLPFQNMSGDPEQEYFADGMVEDITTALSRTKWLFVIARNSTFTYKGRSVDIKQVGRELGVRYVLEGSVRKVAGRIRITAQLIEAEAGTHIWAERYDRAIDDIFALQDEITISTVAAIEPSLRQAEIERAKRKRPENLDAYDLVLRATPLADTGMPEGSSQAIPLLDRALELEPSYALAHGLSAYCHEVLYVRGGMREENRVAAIHHGHAAVAFGPDDAKALIYGGLAIGLVEHDRAQAQEAFEAALALSPSAAAAYLWGSLIMGWGGEAEQAIEWGERGIRLSPFDPWITAALHGMFLGHFLRGRYEEAATAIRKAVRSKPGFSISHMMLAAALVKLGRAAEAEASRERALSLQPNFSIGRQFAAVGAVSALAIPFAEALRAAGFPD